MHTFYTLIMGFLLLFSLHTEAVSFKSVSTPIFNPSKGETFAIPFILDKPARVSMTLHTPDGDPIIQLDTTQILSIGHHQLTWDGKDEAGIVVPDEAFIPTLTAHFSDATTRSLDPRLSSGGEVMQHLAVTLTDNGDVRFSLPAPARVLSRVGIKNGPMLRSLMNWLPKDKGSHILHWNGFDDDHAVFFKRHPDLSHLVTAFRLPDHAIITTGNDQLTYRQYFQQKGWSVKPFQPDQLNLARQDQTLSLHYFTPRTRDIDPQVSLSLNTQSKGDLPMVNGVVDIRVDMPKADQWLMWESQYEVSFFVDYQFVSEQEQGYVPFTWRWTPNALKPGRHVLTVNVSGFRGQVGVKNIAFIIPAPST